MIDRAFITVLLLSISGFVFCAVYMPLENLAYRYTSAKTMVTVNTIALFSFVLPLYLVTSFADGSEAAFRTYDTLILDNSGGYESFVIAVRGLNITEHLSDLWFLGVVCTLLYRSGKYFCSLYHLISNKFEIDDGLWAVEFEKLKQEKKVHHVFLIGSYRLTTPCTFGLRKRYIAIPAAMINSFERDEVELILQHEFYHMVHKDLLRKFFIMLLGCIHWFNPLFHFLKENLLYRQEAACDEEITNNLDDGEKRRYVHLFIKILEVQSENDESEKIGLHFVRDDLGDYKRRLEKIMRKSDKTRVKGKVAVASVALLSMFCGNVVAKAADVPVNQMFSENIEIVEPGTREKIKATDMELDTLFEYTESTKEGTFVEFTVCNTEDTTYEIVYKNPKTTVTAVQNPIDPQHIHQMEDFVWKEHKKNSDGSCKTT